MLKKVVEIAHDILKSHLNENSVAVDFTCGGGNDTLFLSELVKEVYSYDIQFEALEEAKKRCEDRSNVFFFHKSHAFFEEDVTSFDAGIFNLGYYPKGNHEITTDKDTVVETISKALLRLNEKGILVIVCYPGFEKGKEEAEAIMEYCENLVSQKWDVFLFKLVNRKQAPFIIGIEKH